MLKLQAMIGTLTAEFSLIVGTVARLLQVVFWMTVSGTLYCRAHANTRIAHRRTLLNCCCTQLVAHLMGCAWYFMAADAGLGWPVRSGLPAQLLSNKQYGSGVPQQPRGCFVDRERAQDTDR